MREIALSPDGWFYPDYHFMVRRARPLGRTLTAAVESFERDPMSAPVGFERIGTPSSANQAAADREASVLPDLMQAIPLPALRAASARAAKAGASSMPST